MPLILPKTDNGEWAVYAPRYGWLLDTCADGAWGWDVSQAKTATTRHDAAMFLTELYKNVGSNPHALIIRVK